MKNLNGEKKIFIGSILLEWGICGVCVGTSVPLTLITNDIAVNLLSS